MNVEIQILELVSQKGRLTLNKDFQRLDKPRRTPLQTKITALPRRAIRFVRRGWK